MKTTNEILTETGLTYPMLNRLKDLDIIPKPSRKGLGNRKGVIGVFDDDVISTINWVKTQQRQGYSLKEIADKWRERNITEEEVSTDKSGRNRIRLATDLFAELAEKYPDDDFVPGKITDMKEQSDGSVIAKIRLVRIKRI